MSISCRLKIPKSRIGVVIGKNGETKNEIESMTQVKITIDSAEGSIIIEATNSILDPTYVWKARDIIKAIGRGFNADKAFYLIDDKHLENDQIEYAQHHEILNS